jgi:mono/diheme cytochrome c family protein
MIVLAAVGILFSLGAAGAQTQAENMRLFMDGARLWPVYCSQCHNARPGSEFSPQQWDTIMMHMRTQSNMPAKDARAILQYLRGGH